MNSLGFLILSLAQATAEAVPAAEEPPSSSALSPQFFITMIIVFGAFYLLIALPQRKEQEKKLAAVEGMKKGDRVVSTGGIHGTVVRVDKEKGTIVVQIAKGVEVEFSKAAINAIPEPEPEKTEKKA